MSASTPAVKLVDWLVTPGNSEAHKRPNFLRCRMVSSSWLNIHVRETLAPLVLIGAARTRRNITANSCRLPARHCRCRRLGLGLQLALSNVLTKHPVVHILARGLLAARTCLLY